MNTTPTMAPVQGQCTERFEPLRQVFESLQRSDADLGASLALTVDGRFEVLISPYLDGVSVDFRQIDDE